MAGDAVGEREEGRMRDPVAFDPAWFQTVPSSSASGIAPACRHGLRCAACLASGEWGFKAFGPDAAAYEAMRDETLAEDDK